MKRTVDVEELPAPGVSIGGFEYFTVQQICAAIGCADYVLKNIVRDPNSGLGGQKFGTVWLISAQQFHEFVKGGKFQFHERARAARTKDDLVDLAQRREHKRLERVG